MFEKLKVDVERYPHVAQAETFLKALRAFMRTYGLHAIIVYRFGRWVESQSKIIRFLLRLLYYPLEFWINLPYGIHISRSASIGEGLFIGHFGGISIDCCEIGRFCSIRQHTQIKPDHNGCPRIGNGVWIGAHAQIIGAHAIGHGATIGAGAIVKTDIGERCLALGNPARVINKDFDNSQILGIGAIEKARRKNTVTKHKVCFPTYSKQLVQT